MMAHPTICCFSTEPAPDEKGIWSPVGSTMICFPEINAIQDSPGGTTESFPEQRACSTRSCLNERLHEGSIYDESPSNMVRSSKFIALS